MSTTARATITWRYLPRRKVRHALPLRPQSATGHDASALCGTSPSWFAPSDEQWWGTGTQSEYDAVERLPECGRCARLLDPPVTASERKADQ